MKLIKKIFVACLISGFLTGTANAMPYIDIMQLSYCHEWAGGTEEQINDFEMYDFYFTYCMQGRVMNPSP